MNLIVNKYDIFIFELNNTIVNIEKYQYLAWLKTLNINFSFEYFCNKFHPKDFDSIRNFLSNTLHLDNYDELMIIKNKNYLNILNDSINELNLIPGFIDLINLIIKENKKFIIVSDTYKDNIDFFLNLFPILHKADQFYYRELFNINKFNHTTYLEIISNNKFTNNKLIYFTYYDAVLNILNNKIKLINSNNTIIQLNNKNYYDINKEFLDNKIINTLRILSVDMINKANSGHPGMPLGCAPMMFVLWCKIMNINEDKFILSNGHGCALLYSILYLFGLYNLDDLKNFRQLNSCCPGHPEYNPSLGIEVSTGPLGQGIANGVGMAIASKKLNLNNNIYVMCGDGCLMEGISYEACSLAGHLKLNNLKILYDSNNITIDGNTNLSFTENIKTRFESQDWNVLEVLNGDTDIDDIYNKISKKSSKPTIIIIHTTIGYGSLKAGSNASHGSPLGDYNTKELKKYLDYDINETFFVDDDVKTFFSKFKLNKSNLKRERESLITEEILKKKFKSNIINLATRDISNICLNIINENNNNIIIGSADLAESTKTIINSTNISYDNFNGSYLHYGIREHAMTGIANGISCYDLVPIISTFLVFINYCLCGIRMAALSKHKVIYILTHDSVLLGEDGPSHQPVESLTILRSIPDLITIRPYNIYETFNAYNYALNNDGPTAIILSRQIIKNYSQIIGNNTYFSSGGYIIHEPLVEKLDLIIIATGSEVELAFETIKEINDKNIRIVSMPSTNIYDKQNIEYKENILPKNIKKISLEAGSTIGWYKYANYVYGIDTFGASGNINDIKNYFNFNVKSLKKFIYEII